MLLRYYERNTKLGWAYSQGIGWLKMPLTSLFFFFRAGPD